MMETKVENSKYNSYYLSFWIGNDNAIDILDKSIGKSLAELKISF
jgi:hypothetical protein